MIEARSNLPARRTRMIGRDEALEAIRTRVLHGDRRLVTLTGAGGAGKTTLGLEVARRIEPEMPDGAWLVDLSAVRDPGAIAAAWCDALGLLDQERTHLAALTDHLSARQALVVVDNCEHLLPDLARIVDRLLDRCADLRLLATSRTPLRVAGETVVAVQPMELPDATAATDPEALARIPAVELFVERATAVDPDFLLSTATAPAVVAICRRLDGLPLAIELAAAQSGVRTPVEIDERLADRTSALAPVGEPASRHATMHAALDWSHELLDASQQAVFRRLAVFSGGWTADAAAVICSLGAADLPVDRILDDLVEHSLVDRETIDGRSRYRFLAPIAEYAAARLEASGETGAVGMAHAGFYLAVVSGEVPGLSQPEPEDLARTAIEYDNCMAAMRFVEEARIVPLIIGWNVAMLPYWGIRGLHRTADRRLHVALGIVGEEPTYARAAVLAGLATFGRILRDDPIHRAWASESEEIFRSLGDRLAQRTAMAIGADVLTGEGDLDAARAAYDRVWPLVEAMPSDSVFGFWHANVGMIELLRGDRVTAKRELELARGHFEAAPTWFQGRVLRHLGRIARMDGRPRDAVELTEAALRLLLRYGAVTESIQCLEDLAGAAIDGRHAKRAAVLLAAGTSLRDATGTTLSGADRRALGHDIDRTRLALGPAAFTDAWSRGVGLTLEAATAYALARGSTAPSRPVAARGSTLTAREQEIAGLVASGMTNRQIGEHLKISPGTARIHVERILGKLGLTSRVQIATWVVGQRDPDAREPALG